MSVKKHNLNIRVTAKERAALKRAAKARGVTVSELVLKSALEPVMSADPPPGVPRERLAPPVVPS